MVADITPEMKAAAFAFESAAIDAGFDFANIRFESTSWALDEVQRLQIFGVDSSNKSHQWSIPERLT